jgi:hypothetical protein
MAGRIHKQIINYIKSLEKKAKQMNFVKELKKEVETGANGTQSYIIKEGINKGKKATK